MAKATNTPAGQIVAGIYGAGGHRAGENPTLEALVTRLGGQLFQAWQKRAIVRYLVTGSKAGNDIVLIGYSRGGNAAVAIANALGKRGIPIARLLIFDAHSFRDKKIFSLQHNNVARAYNFYQRNPRSAGRFGWWGSNPYWGSPLLSSHINVNQANFTGASCDGSEPVSHLNIISHCLQLGFV
ncbi:MAG: hypothetical protein P8Y42_05655 [Exilibacterium sp.]